MTPDEKPRTRTSALSAALSGVVLLALVAGLLEATGATGPLPAPAISSVRLPDDPTRETSAGFMFTNAQTVTFECALDDVAFTPCGHGIFGSQAYPGPLAAGEHEFRVRAESAGRRSTAASFAWVVLARDGAVPGPNPNPAPEPDPPADDASTASDGVPFEISGSVSGLAPGLTMVVPLELTNPNDVPIEVTRVTMTLSDESDPPGCSGATNFVLRQPTGITSETPVTVPARASITVAVAPQAPQITFLDLGSNQDTCKNTSFELTYSGSAHS